jgi:hypothetical protein
MELTPGQQRLVFVVVVLALAGLGIYLLSARGSGGTPAAAPSTTAGTTAPPPANSPSAASAPADGVPPTVVPPPTPASTVGGAEIYQWLPFTPADLTAAVNTTTAFSKDYATWSYTENAAAYGAKFSGLATSAEITTLEEGYSTAGLAQQRTADKQVSTGSGAINQISSFGSGSITFLVTITNQVTSTQPTTRTPSQYTVTVVSSGSTWQVDNINLSSLGNQ